MAASSSFFFIFCSASFMPAAAASIWSLLLSGWPSLALSCSSISFLILASISFLTFSSASCLALSWSAFTLASSSFCFCIFSSSLFCSSCFFCWTRAKVSFLICSSTSLLTLCLISSSVPCLSWRGCAPAAMEIEMARCFSSWVVQAGWWHVFAQV